MEDRPEGSESTGHAPRVPGLSSLIGAALTVGVAAGFLELAALMFQVHGLHRVGISTFRISRHVLWMVPVAETLVTLGLALLFGIPALVWSARRDGGPVASRRVSRACRWIGMVLGTVLVLAPLLTVRRLHTIAAVALALGAGTRLRRLLVRPTPGWRRASCWTGAMVLVGLPVYSYWQWDQVARAEERAWSGPRPANPAPNLLWIVMDTVSAEHMSLYGYQRPTTPALEGWAKVGITFSMARSAAPWTLPSHVTMFTGLWPYEHGARIDWPYCGPSPTLAEHLGANGYTTAGFAGNLAMCNASYGVGRGFDHYVELLCNHEVSLPVTMFNSTLGNCVLRMANGIGLPVPREIPRTGRLPARELIGHAQAWLGRVRHRNEGGASESRRPFFLFMNFMDVHCPYVPPAGYSRRFWTAPLPPRRQSVPECGWTAIQARDAAPPERRPQLQQELDAITHRLVNLYDDCLGGLDEELGRFLGDLRSSGLLEDTWVVITSDHGEQFGEHRVFGHGASLYNQVTHVPLILIPPLPARASIDDPYEVLRGRQIGVPVSHRDLPVTLTSLLLPGDVNPFPGRSLARHWTADGPAPPDPILAQMEEQRFDGYEVQSDLSRTLDSVIAEDHLLIESSERGIELYDLFADPENERNLVAEPTQRGRLERLKQTLNMLRSQPIRRESGDRSDGKGRQD